MWLVVLELSDRYQQPPWILAGESDPDEFWWLIRLAYYTRMSQPKDDKEWVLEQLKLEDELENGQ